MLVRCVSFFVGCIFLFIRVRRMEECEGLDSNDEIFVILGFMIFFFIFIF